MIFLYADLTLSIVCDILFLVISVYYNDCYSVIM